MKNKLIAIITFILTLSMLCSSAFACTAIYVGSQLTADGSTMFARSEDISNSYNKLFYYSPAGNHKAGEEYAGCYGFTYTFSHDSYAYTAFSDDNGMGICPDCGGEHVHSPYEAGGTNEKGVTVSATETIGCSDALYEADPYEDLGIEEAEITTVLLSEAATAKEGVDLILSIYDNAGCNSGAGIFIADNTETWYIENVTGHQYIALKLNDSIAFFQPNMSIIGKIDLDDENVIASAGIIEVAQNAGTFVGDAEANVIDFLASYNYDQEANGRMVSALEYANAANDFGETLPAVEAYAISNVDAEGNIVPLYTNITLDRAFAIEDVQQYYNIEGIGSARNLETHIFQIYSEDSAADTIEWVSMDDATISPFIPYYPMLITDTYEGYKLSTAPAEFVTEKPESGLYYATTARQWVDGERVEVEGYKVFPENWADSYYWTMDALSNLIRSGEYSEEQVAAVHTAMDERQAALNNLFNGLAPASTDALAKATHNLAIKLVNELIAE